MGRSDSQEVDPPPTLVDDDDAPITLPQGENERVRPAFGGGAPMAGSPDAAAAPTSVMGSPASVLTPKHPGQAPPPQREPSTLQGGAAAPRQAALPVRPAAGAAAPAARQRASQRNQTASI